MVKTTVMTGKNVGNYQGHVAMWASGRFNIKTISALVQGISHRICALIQRADGYGYAWIIIA